MQALMLQLHAMTSRHRLLVIALWVALVLGALPFAARQSDHLTSGGYGVAGSQSTKVEATVRHAFPQISRTSLAVLLIPHAGTDARQLDHEVRRVQRAVRGVPDVRLPKQSLESALFATELVGPLLMPLQVTASEDRAQSIVQVLQRRLRGIPGATGSVAVHVLGESALWVALDSASKRELRHAERIGFPILFIVLLTIFGSIAAAALPLMLGFAAVLVTGALIYFLSLATAMSVFVTNTASMLGIGVAVDYSFFVLARVRQELQEGNGADAALRVALATSGRAVVFSGITVIASLIGLFVVPIGALRSMALGAMLVVAVSITAAVTLLPALIALVGPKRLALRQIRLPRLFRRDRARQLSWLTWTRAVTRRPTVSLICIGGLLLVLCIPALSIRTNTGALRLLNSHDETRRGFAEAMKTGGPGALGPVTVTVHALDRQARESLPVLASRLSEAARDIPHAQEVGLAHVSDDRSDALFTVTPDGDPESPATKTLVGRLRSLLAAFARPQATVAVGGPAATQLDEDHGIAHAMWKVVVGVLVLAFGCMLLLLRSLLLPLKAIVFNLLSVGAAYGVLVVVFQWGWFDQLFHYHSLGYLNTFTPPLILAVVFGLSMDYEVFLLARIRERWLSRGDSGEAVAHGLAASAQTISSAALILVCVFAVFIATGMTTVKELGLGAAVAIGIDATLIRLILVPATMTLLGEWSWWLPRPLARLLPTKPTIAAQPASVT